MIHFLPFCQQNHVAYTYRQMLCMKYICFMYNRISTMQHKASLTLAIKPKFIDCVQNGMLCTYVPEICVYNVK